MTSALRLNRLQLLEQEKLNRNRKVAEEVEAARLNKKMKFTKAKFDYVPSTASTGFTSRNHPSAEDAEVRVHISECGGQVARSFAYRESEALANIDAQTSQKEITSRMPPISPGGSSKAPARKSYYNSSCIVTSNSGSPFSMGFVAPSYSLAQTCAPGEKDGSKLGYIPRYLSQRKAEIAGAKLAFKEEKERLEQEAKIPPGYRLVSEEEKATTIEEANQRLIELEVALRKIPIRFDTQNIRNKREKIELEMDELEQTKIKYSTKRPLYVPK